MPEIICPFVTCGHNDSHVLDNPGHCCYVGTIEFGSYDATFDQFLECPQHYPVPTIVAKKEDK